MYIPLGLISIEKCEVLHAILDVTPSIDAVILVALIQNLALSWISLRVDKSVPRNSFSFSFFLVAKLAYESLN